MTSPLPLDTLLFDPKEFSFLTSTIFRGLTISQGADGWNVTLRAFLATGEAVYCTSSHEDPMKGLKQLLAVLGTRGGRNLWHMDRYYKG